MAVILTTEENTSQKVSFHYIQQNKSAIYGGKHFTGKQQNGGKKAPGNFVFSETKALSSTEIKVQLGKECRDLYYV